jgi:hypothetical protein
MAAFTSGDLVLALNRGNFHLADIIYKSGVRLTFEKNMIDYAKERKNIKLLNWICAKSNKRCEIADLKWAFAFGDEEYITRIWYNCAEPDTIDLIDIIEIIITRGHYLLLLRKLLGRDLCFLRNHVHKFILGFSKSEEGLVPLEGGYVPPFQTLQ